MELGRFRHEERSHSIHSADAARPLPCTAPFCQAAPWPLPQFHGAGVPVPVSVCGKTDAEEVNAPEVAWEIGDRAGLWSQGFGSESFTPFCRGNSSAMFYPAGVLALNITCLPVQNGPEQIVKTQELHVRFLSQYLRTVEIK